jgi:hypothetical protein
LSIFHIARLFANQHQSRLFWPFTEYGLGSISVEVATFARTSCRTQSFQGTLARQEVCSRSLSIWD